MSYASAAGNLVVTKIVEQNQVIYKLMPST